MGGQSSPTLAERSQMTNAQFLATATAATLLETVNGAAKVAKSNPTPENCENFVTIKRAFNTACREMKYHALDLSMARQYLRDGQYRLNKLLTQYD